MQQLEFNKQLLADSLANVEKALRIDMAHAEEINKKNQTQNILIGSGILVLLLAGGLWNRLNYTRRSRKEISKERDRSEKLFLNILPAEVAQELKENGKAAAKNYDMVSILFSDFKEFTYISAQMSAEELVSEINVCFEAFDRIIEESKFLKEGVSDYH